MRAIHWFQHLSRSY